MAEPQIPFDGHRDYGSCCDCPDGHSTGTHHSPRRRADDCGAGAGDDVLCLGHRASGGDY